MAPPAESTPEVPLLVPELLVTDVAASLEFWIGICEFEVMYDRPDEGFAYIHLGSAHVMLDQIGIGRDWVSAPLEHPLGRGVGFQISVPDIAPLVVQLAERAWPLFMAPEIKNYKTGETDVQVSQFLVQDPDGYLIRFQSRAIAP